MFFTGSSTPVSPPSVCSPSCIRPSHDGAPSSARVLPAIPAIPIATFSSSDTGPNHAKRGSKRRRHTKRVALSDASGDYAKNVHKKRRDAAYERVVQLDVDAAALPVNSSGFGGQRRYPPRDKRDAATLVVEERFLYVKHNGDGSIPLVDCHRRLVMVLGGHPRDSPEWEEMVVRPVARAIEEGARNVKFSMKEKKHKRGFFGALAIGVSYGGEKVCISSGESAVPLILILSTPVIAASPSQREGSCVGSWGIAQFSGSQALLTVCRLPLCTSPTHFHAALFATYNWPMYEEYQQHQAVLHEADSRLRQNFPDSVFSCMTVNTGPISVTEPHADSANKPDGWCSISAFGPFDPTKGGQVVCWDFGVIIELPPGCTAFIPSAICVHSNCPIQEGEQWYSITQYTAGGLFRWVANGFQTEDQFLKRATDAQMAQYWVDREMRWERGLRFFPIIPEEPSRS